MLIWAVLFGRVLYQRDSFWDGIVNKWAHQLPLPSFELASTRALATYRRLKKILDVGDEEAVIEQALSLFTHLARMTLLRNGIFPASRPELPEQLRRAGDGTLAESIQSLYSGTTTKSSQVRKLLAPWMPFLDNLADNPFSANQQRTL
jgi:hypothetical protein